MININPIFCFESSLCKIYPWCIIELAIGGTSTVWACKRKNSDSNEIFVVKAMPRSFPENQAIFLNEVNLLANMDFKFIIK